MMEGFWDIDDSEAVQGIEAFSALAKDSEDAALKLTELVIQQDNQAFPNDWSFDKFTQHTPNIIMQRDSVLRIVAC